MEIFDEMGNSLGMLEESGAKTKKTDPASSILNKRMKLMWEKFKDCCFGFPPEFFCDDCKGTMKKFNHLCGRFSSDVPVLIKPDDGVEINTTNHKKGKYVVKGKGKMGFWGRDKKGLDLELL